MRFIHAADIHLDSPLSAVADRGGDFAEALVGAARRALTNMVDLAIDRKVDFVLLAGDLWDGDWKDAHAGLFFVRQAARLQVAGVPVLAVAGNHDAAAGLAGKLPWPDNVHFFSARKPQTKLLLDGAVAVHGQSFPQAAVTDNIARNYPARVAGAFNIGLLHTALEGAADHAPYAPCSVADLRGKGYDYWALGHVHAARVVHQDPWIVYPGNLQGRHVRETGPKGCVLVEAADGQVESVETLICDVARWAEVAVDLTGIADWDAAFAAARDRLAAAADQADGRLLAARLRFVGATALDDRLRARPNDTQAAALAAAAQAAGEVWIERVKLRTRPPLAAADSGGGAGAGVLADLGARLAASDGEERAALDKALADLQAGWPDWLKDAAAAELADGDLAADALARLGWELDGEGGGDAA